MAVVLAEQNSVALTSNKELADLAEELGLESQAKRWRAGAQADGLFTPFNADEEALWMAHCPTRYADEQHKARTERLRRPSLWKQRSHFHHRNLRSYDFDVVPPEVLHYWHAVKQCVHFDSYEIWTTETTYNDDPLLVGILGPQVFPLARWGESSPANFSLADYARKLVRDVRAKAQMRAQRAFSWTARGRQEYFNEYLAEARGEDGVSWEVPGYAAAERICARS